MSFLKNHDNGQRARIYFLSLAVCATLLFFAGLGKRDLMKPDEPRVAGIAAEMARSGELVVPRLNGDPFLEKPPLYFWTLSAVFNLLGESSYTARIASALAAICGVALVFILARSIGLSPLTAFIAGFVLATSCEYFSLGRRCLIDMMLCLFTTATMVCFFHASRSLPGRAPWYVGFVMSLSCAVMTKGLVGLAIPVSALSIWLLVEKNFSRRAWYLLLISSALSFIPIGIWIWFLYNDLGWNGIYEIIWTNNFGRFIGSYQQHIAPFYYYIKKFPEQFLPWTFFLPIALIHHFREIRKQRKSFSLFLLAWFGVPFLLLSISAGKRGMYLLPLYPAAALLVGTAIGRVLEGGEAPARWFSLSSEILVLVLISVSLAFSGVCIYFGRSFSIWLPASISGLCLGVFAYRRIRRKDLTGFFKILVVVLLVLYPTFDIGIMPIFNHGKSYKPLFQYCKNLSSEGFRVSLFKPSERIRGAAVFYLGKTIPVLKEEANLKNFLRSEENGVVVSREKSVQKLKSLYIMKRFNIDNEIYIVVS